MSVDKPYYKDIINTALEGRDDFNLFDDDDEPENQEGGESEDDDE